MLGSDEMRAWYGPDHVSHAADRGAIGTLLISDELFRSVCEDSSPSIYRLTFRTEPVTLALEKNMSLWWRQYSKKAGRCSYSQVCTSQDNVSMFDAIHLC